MSFWSRLRQQKLKIYLSANGFGRCYTRNHRPLVADQCIHSHSSIPVLNNPNCTVHSSLPEYHWDVRFYAAPVQANHKKEEKDPSGPRLNEEITSPSVRLVTDEGHVVISRHDALDRAKCQKMDLVEVDRHAKPPVCKILDYHKEKYIQQTKEKERAKSKPGLKKGGFKEVRFAAKIKQKDLQMKADMVKRLMESGHRVKCTAIEPTSDMDLGTLLSRFSALIEDIAVEETGPQIEKKQAYIVVRHTKFGPPKKGSGKKASKAAVSSNQSNDTTESDSETESGNSQHLWAADAPTTKSGQSVFDEEDDIQSSGAVNRNPKPLFEHTGLRTPFSPSSGAPNHATVNRYARDPKPARSGGHGDPTKGRQPRFSLNPESTTRPTQQDSSGSSLPSSPSKSSGIFDSGNLRPKGHEQNAPNRYKMNDSSARNPSTPPHRNNSPSQGRWGAFSADNKSENQAEIHRR